MIAAASVSAVVFVLLSTWYLRCDPDRRTLWQRLALGVSACAAIGFAGASYLIGGTSSEEVIEYPSETVTFGDPASSRPEPGP